MGIGTYYHFYDWPLHRHVHRPLILVWLPPGLIELRGYTSSLPIFLRFKRQRPHAPRPSTRGQADACQPFLSDKDTSDRVIMLDLRVGADGLVLRCEAIIVNAVDEQRVLETSWCEIATLHSSPSLWILKKRSYISGLRRASIKGECLGAAGAIRRFR